ncbi:MAG: hypothetical protein ACYCXU_09805 [Thermoleophilia bacterium]
MSSKRVALALIAGVVTLLMILQISHGKMERQVASFGAAPAVTGPNFSITEDSQNGYVTAENATVKVVWHYKTLSSEYSNRGGGSIYELYDKRTDPGMQHNLAALYDAGGGQTTPNTPGIGGLGAVHIWELGRGVSAADNGKFARLVSQSHSIDAEGNAVFQTVFIVKSSLAQYDSDESSRPDNYQVEKKWIVYPNGQIKLDIHVKILRDIMASEPAYDFSFSQGYGFTTASSLGHNWGKECGGPGSSGTTNSNNRLTVINDIGGTPDDDYQLLDSEFFSLYGRPGGSMVRVKMDNGGKGFENGGLFNLGYNVWGNTNNPTVEYSKYTNAAYGNTLRFFAWWGGAPPQAPRFKPLSQGTNWSDSIWIEVLPESSPSTPQVMAESVAQGIAGSAALNWDTDIVGDTNLTYQRADGTGSPSQISDPVWAPNHQVDLSGLVPGKVYNYEMKSQDGSGEAIKSGSFTANGMPGVYLNLAMTGSNWRTYSDYQQGILSADFMVSNSGLENATSVDVINVTANSGVSGQPVSPSIGDVLSGGQRDFTVAYRVPPGVNVFSTEIYVKARDVAGRDYYFPRLAPHA